METLSTYFLKSLLLSAAFTGYYWLFLRNRQLHQYNRFYLLAALAASLVIPLCLFEWHTNVLASRLASAPAPASEGTDTPSWLVFFRWLAQSAIPALVAAAISLLLLCRLALKIRWIYLIKKRHHPVEMDGYFLIGTALQQAPFTFLNNLFWREGLSMQDENGARILRHELTHIREKHTYDKLFTQSLTCIFWLNPFFRLMEHELNMIHEFIADASAVEEGDTSAFAQMLLHAQPVETQLYHSFFSSPIKRRLTMIIHSSKQDRSFTRKFGVFPVALLVVAALSFGGARAQTAPDIRTDTASKPVPVEIIVVGRKVDTKRTDTTKHLQLIGVKTGDKRDTVKTIIVQGRRMDPVKNK